MILIEKNFADISYQTKRLGKVAYDTNAFILKSMKPVFVDIEEWQKNQKIC